MQPAGTNEPLGEGTECGMAFPASRLLYFISSCCCCCCRSRYHTANSAVSYSAAAAAAAGPCDSALGMSSSALRVLVAGLLVLLALQAGLLAVLGIRMRRAARTAARAASARPPPTLAKAKKPFVAVGRQLRPRPSPPRKDIEDCCQMTLCETVRAPRD